MPIIEIDGLGRVEVDDTFNSKSPAEQDRIIQDIAAQAGGTSTYEITAPNGKTYQVEGPAGASDEEIRAEVLRQHPDAARPSGPAPNRSSRETYQVLERLVKQLYPHATITSGKRSAEHNKAVGGVPRSSHVSGHGLDVVGLNAAERADLKHKMEAAGVQLDEYLYHDAGSGLHLHLSSTRVPEDLFPPPEGPDAHAVPVNGEPAAMEAVDEGAPMVANPQPQQSDNSIFRLPKDWNEFGKGLEYGTGAVVEGIGCPPSAPMAQI